MTEPQRTKPARTPTRKRVSKATQQAQDAALFYVYARPAEIILRDLARVALREGGVRETQSTLQCATSALDRHINISSKDKALMGGGRRTAAAKKIRDAIDQQNGTNVVRFPVIQRSDRRESVVRDGTGVVQLHHWRWRNVLEGLRAETNMVPPATYPLALAIALRLQLRHTRRALGAYVDKDTLYYDCSNGHTPTTDKEILLAIVPTILRRYGEPTDPKSVASLAHTLAGGDMTKEQQVQHA